MAADQKAARPRSASAEAVSAAEAALVHANLIATKSKKENKQKRKKNERSENVGGVLHHASWPKTAKGVDVSHGYNAKDTVTDTDTLAVVCALNAQFDAPLLLLADPITCSF